MAGREPPDRDRVVMRLPFGAYVGVRPVPATLAKIDLGSRPDPVSEATNVRSLRAGPRRTGEKRGGVSSPIQKRNVNRPAPARVVLSNTTWYVPGVGRITAETGDGSKNVGR